MQVSILRFYFKTVSVNICTYVLILSCYEQICFSDDSLLYNDARFQANKLVDYLMRSHKNEAFHEAFHEEQILSAIQLLRKCRHYQTIYLTTSLAKTFYPASLHKV